MSKMTKAQIIHSYSLNGSVVKPENSIRNGYYQIATILKLKEENRVESFLVKAKWNPKEPDFTNSPLFKVQLSTLYNRNSEGPKEIGPEDLEGAIIYISNFGTAQYEYQGEQVSTFKATWAITGFDNLQQTEGTLLQPNCEYPMDQNKPIFSPTVQDEEEQLLLDEDPEYEFWQLFNDQLEEDAIEDNQLLYDLQAKDEANTADLAELLR